MPARGSSTPGLPCWSELACTSLDQSLAFYRRVLGWDYSEPDESLGGYREASVSGHPVAGIYTLGDEELPGQWLIYLGVDDADEAVTQAVTAGARPVLPVTQHQDQARIAVIATPAATAQGVCQRLVDAGIRSILSFAPVPLAVPAGVDVRRVDLASELQLLAVHQLADEEPGTAP